MSNIKFRIGDTVKVIGESYVSLPKGPLWKSQSWKQSYGRQDERVMLGGEYSILDIQGQYVQLTDNNINNCGMCNAGDLVPLSEVRYCDFSVGDQVKFLPKCDHIDIQFLQISLAYSFSEPNKQYRIVEILNDYYIFLDFKPENSSAIPFRWVDFQVV